MTAEDVDDAAVAGDPTRDILTLVHGDDYCSAGAGPDLDWLEAVLSKKYEIKSQRIGRGRTTDGKEKSAEGQVLNRVVS